jgi:hypothetical protein
MTCSFIPQRIKRAKQQITVKLYQDQLATLDKYGRFIDDGRDYIISQALELVFKRDKEFARWFELDRNAGSNAERTLTRTESAGSASPSRPQRERGKRPRTEVVGEMQTESLPATGCRGRYATPTRRGLW